MDVNIEHGDAIFSFTVRVNAVECRLDLIGYRDRAMKWDALSEQCKPPHQRREIEIPFEVQREAISRLHREIKVSGRL